MCLVPEDCALGVPTFDLPERCIPRGSFLACAIGIPMLLATLDGAEFECWMKCDGFLPRALGQVSLIAHRGVVESVLEPSPLYRLRLVVWQMSHHLDILFTKRVFFGLHAAWYHDVDLPLSVLLNRPNTVFAGNRSRAVGTLVVPLSSLRNREQHDRASRKSRDEISPSVEWHSIPCRV